MLEQASPLNRTMLQSSLRSQSRIRPKGTSLKRRTVTSLLLTSLVDAFSILVIFLIMNHASSQETLEFDNSKLQLPIAEQSQLIEDGVVVKVENNMFTVGKDTVGLGQLVEALKAAKGELDVKKDGIIIVADKKMDFADLSPVITAGSNAGFIKFKFAVQTKQ